MFVEFRIVVVALVMVVLTVIGLINTFCIITSINDMITSLVKLFILILLLSIPLYLYSIVKKLINTKNNQLFKYLSNIYIGAFLSIITIGSFIKIAKDGRNKVSDNIAAALTEYYNVNQKYPDTLDQLLIDKSTERNYKYYKTSDTTYKIIIPHGILAYWEWDNLNRYWLLKD